MSRKLIRDLLKAEGGAVAPTIGLSLFALVAAGGLAFDYSRMATLDTELQNAADQAALAAASQLDGKTGTCSRAAQAARTLVANQTRFSNDNSGLAITIANEPACDAVGNIRFYQDKAKATPATLDTNANFVLVTVNSRQAFFALTPIVAAFSSGALAASAYAGLGSAVCKTPPVMICNPDEPLANTNDDYDFDANSKIGYGVRLIGSGSYVPGNFGFLETGFGNGANNLLQALGYNTPPGDCIAADGVTTKTGLNASVMDGLNTRFDIVASNDCPGSGPCSPSINTRKDLVRGNACDWEEVDANASNFASKRYRPTTPTLYPAGTAPIIMGLPRDLCHAWSEAGSCTGAGGRMGDGVWDRDAYFLSNYGWNNSQWTSNTGLSASATRYQVYQWEINNPGSVPTPQSVGGSQSAYSRPVAGMCRAPGITPGGPNVDRRRISAAVINCQALGVNGHEVDLSVIKWIDLFLVEPSLERKKCKSGSGCNTKYTDKTDVYVEIIGETNSGTSGATAGQVVRRDTPYLIE